MCLFACCCNRYGEGAVEGRGYGTSARSAVLGNGTGNSVVSLYVTWALAAVYVVGQVALMAFNGITNVPLMLKKYDSAFAASLARRRAATLKRFADAEGAAAAVVASSASDEAERRLADCVTRRQDWVKRGMKLPPVKLQWDRLATAFGLLLLSVVFVWLHNVNYPNDRSGLPNARATNLELYTVIGIFNAPLWLSGARSAISVPDTRWRRAFVTCYDVLVATSHVRNHLLLALTCLAGLAFTPATSLLLADIVTNSRTFGNIVGAVARPVPKLCLVLYVMMCTSAIYAHFGLAWFEDHFKDNGSLTDDGCHSVAGCFLTIFYKGIPAKNLAGVLDAKSDIDGFQFFKRIMFDLSFFIWVAVILFGIVTGLLVDAFGTQRNAEKARLDTLLNSCFICGYARQTYDEKNKTPVSFDEHKDVNHGIWEYVYFFRHLQTKDRTEYNGAESYVDECIKKGTMTWLPTRTSLALENFAL